MIEKHFLSLILVFSFLGYLEPDLFIWAKSYIPMLLGIIMLGMGMSLNFSDLWDIRKEPKWIIVGVSLQFLIMPIAAIVIGCQV